jgi:hypothetical protein
MVLARMKTEELLECFALEAVRYDLTRHVYYQQWLFFVVSLDKRRYINGSVN